MTGKQIPEVNPANKKEKFPQDVYVSLVSAKGCYCTITVHFPREKEADRWHRERGRAGR